MLAPTDAVACGWADGVLARFEIRAGRIRSWDQVSKSEADAAPQVTATPRQWREFATQGASLAARLEATARVAAAAPASPDNDGD
jgi:excinuclease ABC subunit C